MAHAATAYALSDRQLDIETPEHVLVGYELADLGSRFTAHLIDILLLGVAFIAVAVLFIAAGATSLFDGMAGSLAVGAFAVVSFLLSWGYFIWFEGFRDGQTPGKKWMKIRVVQDGGYPMTFRAAAVRNLLRLIDMQPGVAWGVGALSMMLSSQTKRLGDLAAGTVVIRDRAGEPIPEERERPDENARPMGAPRLTDQEFAALSMYVQRRATLDGPVRSQLAGTLVQRLAPRFPDDPRRGQVSYDQFLTIVYDEEGGRRRAAGAGGRAGSAQATGLFRRQKRTWDEYDRALAEARERGLAEIGEARVSRFAAMYRAIAADLARARTYGGSPELLYALERSVGAGHNLLYRAPAQGWAGVRRWVTGGFPALVRKRWRPIALAAALTFGPALVTYVVAVNDPAEGRALAGPVLVQRAEAAEDREAHGKGYIRAAEEGGSSALSGEIMTNNVKVTFIAFAGGIVAGIGTVLILVFNGVMLGAGLGVFANAGATVYFLTFILPHGVIEMTAICIAGGAGLWLGSALVLPGRMTRREALVVRGREAISLIGGTACMLVVAGTIEGFISPSDLPREVKFAVASLAALLLLAWIFFAGRDADARRAADAAAQR